jgi:hypothetical protein
LFFDRRPLPPSRQAPPTTRGPTVLIEIFDIVGFALLLLAIRIWVGCEAGVHGLIDNLTRLRRGRNAPEHIAFDPIRPRDSQHG